MGREVATCAANEGMMTAETIWEQGKRIWKFGVIPGAVQREAVRRRPGIRREVWRQVLPMVPDLRSSIACCIASGTTRMLKMD